MTTPKVSFLAFFVLWAKVQGWRVPLLHVEICKWLETCSDPERVLMVFRGAAKSTIYAVYKAWRLYEDPARRSLIWSADGPTAEMLTADVINVLRNHPLTQPLLGGRKPGKKRFWVNGARDARNASMRAVGVDSNATGSRADDVDFDDVEVQGNIETPEARQKIRYRISDSTHILVPGGQATYIGTPHTSDSIYPEVIAGGAAVLKIPLFKRAVRYTETEGRYDFAVPFEPMADGYYVMTGIHKGARMLVEGVDYILGQGKLTLRESTSAVLDIYTGCAWPERFDREEVALRRRKVRTLNAWDSQYMLEAKPLHEIRLDPARIHAYDAELKLEWRNKHPILLLGSAQIISARAYWDPSKGKVGNDASALSLILDDARGNQYWHCAEAMTGELAEFADTRNTTIKAGQVMQVVDLIKRYRIPSVYVENNGVGAHVSMILLRAIRQEQVTCGVIDQHVKGNKSARILGAVEPSLSSGILWAHVRVLDGPASQQMLDWIPYVENQADDYIDSLSGALLQAPVRIAIARNAEIPSDRPEDHWRPRTGTAEVEYER